MILPSVPLAGLIAASAAGAMLAWAIATAQERPLAQRAEVDTGTHEFQLTDSAATEVLKYRRRRDILICNRSEQNEGAPAMAGESARAERAMALQIQHGATTERIRPGRCRVVQTRSVTISAAEPLEPGWVLQGTVETQTLGYFSRQLERPPPTDTAADAEARRPATEPREAAGQGAPGQERR